MNSGILNVYKESGYTSFDVVARLRGIFKVKKIGHTGTLDPEATGVLPICIGKATKLSGMLTDKDKVYECVMTLGIETDTYDMTGRVLEKKTVTASEQEVVDALNTFVGDIMQVPPMYSAVRVGGKRLYELARAGEEVERKPRQVKVYSIDILRMELPDVTVRIHCGSGTYIRSICHDLGQLLGCGCAMKSLQRTRVSEFDIGDARTVDEIKRIYDNGGIDGIITPIDEMFHKLNTVYVMPSDDVVKMAVNGAKLPDSIVFSEAVSSFEEDINYRLYLPDGRFLGIYRFDGDRQFIPDKFFLE